MEPGQVGYTMDETKEEVQNMVYNWFKKTSNGFGWSSQLIYSETLFATHPF